MLPHRHLNILSDRERRKQGAILEQDAAPLLQRIAGVTNILVQNLDIAFARPVQAQNGAQQDRLPGP